MRRGRRRKVDDLELAIALTLVLTVLIAWACPR